MIDSPHAAAPESTDAMLTLRLPNGDTREVPAGTPAREVVAGIGERLAAREGRWPGARPRVHSGVR